MSDDDWRRVIDTNLTGVFYCCNAAIPHLRTRGGGWIINISSLAGKNAFVGGAAYCASKAGAERVQRSADAGGAARRHPRQLRHAGIGRDRFLARRQRAAAPTGSSPSEDVAQVVMDLLAHPERSLPSRVELRPSRPPKK